MNSGVLKDKWDWARLADFADVGGSQLYSIIYVFYTRYSSMDTGLAPKYNHSNARYLPNTQILPFPIFPRLPWLALSLQNKHGLAGQSKTGDQLSHPT